jgi:hypothetical protein
MTDENIAGGGGHAAWDAYHYLRDRVVARSYAEFWTSWSARPFS